MTGCKNQLNGVTASVKTRKESKKKESKVWKRLTKGPITRLHKSQTTQGNINQNLIVQLDWYTQFCKSSPHPITPHN